MILRLAVRTTKAPVLRQLPAEQQLVAAPPRQVERGFPQNQAEHQRAEEIFPQIRAEQQRAEETFPQIRAERQRAEEIFRQIRAEQELALAVN